MVGTWARPALRRRLPARWASRCSGGTALVRKLPCSGRCSSSSAAERIPEVHAHARANARVEGRNSATRSWRDGVGRHLLGAVVGPIQRLEVDALVPPRPGRGRLPHQVPAGHRPADDEARWPAWASKVAHRNRWLIVTVHSIVVMALLILVSAPGRSRACWSVL